MNLQCSIYILACLYLCYRIAKSFIFRINPSDKEKIILMYAPKNIFL